MKTTVAFLICIPVVCCFFSISANGMTGTADTSIIISFKEMKYLGSVDERYQSYNVEMVEVLGGEFWRPYKTMDSLPATSFDFSNRNQMFRKLPPINLADKRLLNLAKALAPAYVRVSGSWTNTVYFQDNDSSQT